MRAHGLDFQQNSKWFECHVFQYSFQEIAPRILNKIQARIKFNKIYP